MSPFSSPPCRERWRYPRGEGASWQHEGLRTLASLPAAWHSSPNSPNSQTTGRSPHLGRAELGSVAVHWQVAGSDHDSAVVLVACGMGGQARWGHAAGLRVPRPLGGLPGRAWDGVSRGGTHAGAAASQSQPPQPTWQDAAHKHGWGGAHAKARHRHTRADQARGHAGSHERGGEARVAADGHAQRARRPALLLRQPFCEGTRGSWDCRLHATTARLSLVTRLVSRPDA